MKKNLKRGLTLLMAAMLLFSLCGCAALDEMRQNQALFDENGNLLWNGSTYKMLPYNEYFRPEYDDASDVSATASDVPVLLSPMLAAFSLSPCADGTVLHAWIEEGVYFCREDLYDDLSARMTQLFTPELVCYSYSLYDEQTGEFSSECYTLTQEQVDVLELIVTNESPATMGEGWYLDYQWSVGLLESSADMLFQRNSLDIACSGSTYYLLLYTEEGSLAYTVPAGCNATLDAITRAYQESEAYFYKDWDSWDNVTEATFADEL